MFLQYGHGATDLFKPGKGNFTQSCGLQSYGGIAVATVVYAIPAKNLAGQIETCDLFAAVITDAKCLHRATANRVYGLKLVTTMKYILVFMNGSAPLNHPVQPIQRAAVQSQWQAQRTHAAIVAIAGLNIESRRAHRNPCGYDISPFN